MISGRRREVAAIVAHDRAVQVGKLLLGELDGPMELIFHDDYLVRPRRELKSGIASLSNGQLSELKRFCSKNFGTSDWQRLADLYEPLLDNNCYLRLSLIEFATLIGRPRDGVLRGAPHHATIVISPWGLQTEYPEMHLVRDMSVALNLALDLEEALTKYKCMPLMSLKDGSVRTIVADLRRRSSYHHRMCILSCFNLTEAYINGLAWEYSQTNDLSKLSNRSQKYLRGDQDSILDRLSKIPSIVTSKSPGPLNIDREPLKTFRDIVKPFRDSVVHASPFSASERFGGYDKLTKLYGLELGTVVQAVNLTLEMIGEIHRFVGGSGRQPQWIPGRREDGGFELGD